MSLAKTFEITSVSVGGGQHRRENVANQDRYAVIAETHFILLLISDGCGSCLHSEIGAELMIRFGCDVLLPPLRRYARSKRKLQLHQHFFDRVSRKIHKKLLLFLKTKGITREGLHKSPYLATLSGAIITQKKTVLFNNGELFSLVNGKHASAGISQDNHPPYFAYSYYTTNFIEKPEYRLQLQEVYPTSRIQTLGIGTDGWYDYLIALEEKESLPSTTTPLPPLKELFLDDALFRNPNTMQLFFEQVSADIPLKGGRVYHLLGDDFTGIFLRRVQTL